MLGACARTPGYQDNRYDKSTRNNAYLQVVRPRLATRRGRDVSEVHALSKIVRGKTRPGSARTSRQPLQGITCAAWRTVLAGCQCF